MADQNAPQDPTDGSASSGTPAGMSTMPGRPRGLRAADAAHRAARGRADRVRFARRAGSAADHPAADRPITYQDDDRDHRRGADPRRHFPQPGDRATRGRRRARRDPHRGRHRAGVLREDPGGLQRDPPAARPVPATLGPGNSTLMPWIAVSHLVSSREIPFDIPGTSVPNAEGVRVAVDLLVTFRVVAPEKFVFAISAPDFDQVCQASGQDALRRLIRATTTDGVLDLAQIATETLAKDIGEALDAYGVKVGKAVLTYVRLPDDVMQLTRGAAAGVRAACRGGRGAGAAGAARRRHAGARPAAGRGTTPGLRTGGREREFRLAQLSADSGLPRGQPLGLRPPAARCRPRPRGNTRRSSR